MIHAHISVPPYYRNVKYGPDMRRLPDSPPPSVIIEQEFSTWNGLLVWCRLLGLQSPEIEMVCDNPNNEYAGVEILLLDVTGQISTNACLSIDGTAEDRPATYRDEDYDGNTVYRSQETHEVVRGTTKSIQD